MNYKMIGRFMAQLLSIEALAMLPALICSLIYKEYHVSLAFVYTLLIIGFLVGGLLLICRKAGKGFRAKEGLVCVGISWIVLSLTGCLPFFISREIPSYIDALFEIVSGFTTTGASILTDVEAMSHGNLLWRSSTHWLGGMGVLVLLLAIAPGNNTGFTMHLLRAESPGPSVDKLVPRMRKTAGILYLIYIAMTVLCLIFLLVGKMPLFDALCTALGTAGTGGFGIKADSMASYSPYLQNVTTVFMILFGVNFSCYYLLLLREFKSVFKDEELRMYLGIIFASILMITLNVRDMYETLGETVRHAAFQVGSIITTSGFATTDFDQWPSFSKAILMCLMAVGACAGSTGGGLKCARLLLLLKSLKRNIGQILNPRRVQVVRNNGGVVSETVLDNTNAYLAAYVVILFAGFLVISLDGLSVASNFTAVLSCFNNIGPGLEAVGPMFSYASYSDFSTLVLTACMLLGRLEIFPILVLFTRSTWKNH